MRSNASQGEGKTLSPWWRLMSLAAVLLVLLSGCAGGRLAADSRAAAGAESEAQFEARYGVRFTQLAVTGQGSWLDIRFLVTDPDKANEWINNPDLQPAVVVQRSGETLYPPPPRAHIHQLEFGRQYYALYNNKNGAVKPGDEVMLVVDNLGVGLVAAR